MGCGSGGCSLRAQRPSRNLSSSLQTRGEKHLTGSQTSPQGPRKGPQPPSLSPTRRRASSELHPGTPTQLQLTAHQPPATSRPPLARRGVRVHSLLQTLPAQEGLFVVVSTASWPSPPSGCCSHTCGPPRLTLDPDGRSPQSKHVSKSEVLHFPRDRISSPQPISYFICVAINLWPHFYVHTKALG